MVYLRTPMNYVGNKFKLLDFILPHIPDNINTFVDVFCGSCNVGVNVNAKFKVFNDKQQQQLISLYNYIKNNNINDILKEIQYFIDKYDLNKENKEGYLELRKDYNQDKTDIKLFVIICHSFSNYMRFNNKGDFNHVFGNRYFNKTIHNNLIKFHEIISSDNIIFTNKSFIELEINQDSFYYCDPPYLFTDANYNKNWSIEHERGLYNFLNLINSKQEKFMLSNVLFHNNKENQILLDFINKNGYNFYTKDYNYASCSYNKLDKNKSVEVIVTNY